VAADGSNLAVRSGAHAIALRPEVKTFDLQLWGPRRGLSPPPDPQAAVDRDWDCDRSACKGKPGRSVTISGWWTRRVPPEERLSGLCAGADLVVVRATLERLPSACGPTLVLDGADFAHGGSLELWRRDGTWEGQWSSAFSGDRPWTRVPTLR
jgi:competence protein ComEC